MHSGLYIQNGLLLFHCTRNKTLLTLSSATLHLWHHQFLWTSSYRIYEY